MREISAKLQTFPRQDVKPRSAIVAAIEVIADVMRYSEPAQKWQNDPLYVVRDGTRTNFRR